MPDAYLDWSGDFQVSSSGGLLLADGVTYANQRIIRRLLTAVKSYVWHPEYGAGLPQKIGEFPTVPSITALVRSQIALESSVSPTPPAVVTVTENPNDLHLYIVTIKYTSAATGEPVTLSFTT